MYAWKVDVGIWPDSGVTNINQLVITDENVPFIIPTGNINIIGEALSEEVGYSGVYDFGFNVLGQDVDTIYGLGRTFGSGDIDTFRTTFSQMTNVFPSIPLAYPNMWDDVMSDSPTVRGVGGFYYFRQLNKLFVRCYASTSTAVYTVNEDGSLVKLSGTELNNSSGLGISIQGSPEAFTYFCFFDSSKDLTLENLTDLNNYREIVINVWSGARVNFFSKNSIGAQEDAAQIAQYLFGTELPDPDWQIGSDDPFNPGGDSSEGGGGGDFDNTSTPIEIPNLPTVSAASTGFISLFNPTLSQLNELASYLWSDLFEIDGWKKLFADPMDAILGLSILPVPIPTSGPKEVKVGNIGTGISLNVASTQFVEVECGSINVNEYWGAYLDYSPYTQCQIYLPYVGTRPISVDEIMGKTINVKYHVDILTGACCCFIKCGDSVLYTFNGQCSIPIPINSANYTSVINGIISVAASVGSMIATGGASAPLAVPHLASTVANQMKPNIEKSGAISGSGAVLNIQTPYLILTRPRQALPKDQNTFTGYPSFLTVTLGELSGYTEVYNIHLENIPATADELSEIETLLKGGVIF